MAELYTLFARVRPTELRSVLDFGADYFTLQSAVPMIPNVEFANLPIIADIGLCGAGVLIITLVSFLIPNIFVDFCLGLITILGYCIFCVMASRETSLWIPIVWPALVQFFVLTIEITAKAAAKQTRTIDTIRLFGYDINKYPNSIPFIKNIIQHPKKTDITMCCIKIRLPQLYLEANQPKEIIYQINEAYKIIVDGILKHSGIIDKTSNNAIIGYWLGKNHALNAVKAVSEINSIINTENIKVSCGVDTENAVFGILGSENFANYTVVGNVTDITARLENACIFHNTHMLISNNTLRFIKDKITATHKGSISIHGLNSQLDFYEIVRFIND